MPSILRSNLVQVDRKVRGQRNAQGEPTDVVQNIYTNLPCVILPFSMNPEGDFKKSPASTVIATETHIAIFDGIGPSQFGGAGAGGTVNVNSINYHVNGAATAAFPDLQVNDRITDQDAQTFLVTAVTRYPMIRPSLELRLAFGASW